MPATVPQLGARALRKIGLALIPQSAVAAAGPALTSADVAARVARQLGVPVAQADWPASLGTADGAELGQRVLRSLGVNAIAGTAPAGTIVADQIVEQALRSLGVNPAGPNAVTSTVGPADPARRALLLLGVNPQDAPGPASGSTTDFAGLATQALVALTITASDETPSVSDQALATSQVVAVHDQLVALDYAAWPETAVPLSVAPHYISMVKHLLGPYFGLPGNAEAYASALEMIRQQSLTGPIAQARAEARVASVHDMLAAEGLADWLLTAIPLALADVYAGMAAALMAPVFGKPPDPAARETLLGAARRFVLSGTRGQALGLSALNGLHVEAVALGLADWTTDTIPVSVSDAYADLVQQALSPAYGQPDTPDLRASALARIRRVVLSGARGQALAQAEIAAVHDALVAQGIVSWPLSAVPVAFAAHYVTMAAANLAPAMDVRQDAPDRQVNRAEYDAAQEAIRKAAVIVGLASRVADRVQAIASELAALGLADWDADHIPAYLADAVTDMAAMQMAAEFGKPFDVKLYAAMEARVRRTIMGGPLGQALAEAKIRAVHADLEGRGRVRWTLHGDMPVSAEEAYVFMAAAWLAPECDVKVDPGWWQMGDMMISRYISVPSLHRPVVATYF